MSNSPPRLTDRAALERARHRTRPDALFLHDLAAERFEETLETVNRSFTDVAIVTGHPEFWQDRFPGARVVADTDTLDLSEGAHDLVLHAMALHWADDPVGQLVQSRRALRPDGMFLGAFPGGRSLAELRQVMAEAETLARGGLSPRIAPMMELRDAGGLLQRAGFALPVADADRFDVTYADAQALMQELRAMGETNALAARDRAPLPPSMIRAVGALYGDRFPAPDAPNRIAATFEIVHLSGWAPADSQPKPLRPGSASSRLADALGSSEQPLRDDSPESRD